MPNRPATSEEYRYDVFISYSHTNEVWVRGELLQRLEQAGLKVIIDFRDFEPGAPVLTEMERAVIKSRKTVLILTPAYVDSEWAEFENILAQTLDPGARRRRVVPVMLQQCELPLRIRNLVCIDMSSPQSSEAQFQRLLKALTRDNLQADTMGWQDMPRDLTEMGSTSSQPTTTVHRNLNLNSQGDSKLGRNSVTGQESWRTQRIESLRRQLAILYESQNYLEEQAALTMPTTPPSVVNSLNEVKKSISRIRLELKSLGVELESSPHMRTPPTYATMPPSLWLYDKSDLIQIIGLNDLDWHKAMLTVGRSRNCNIKIDLKYTRVGRRHARLAREEATFILYDGVDTPSNLGSYVNGERLDWEVGKILGDGDRIVFGGLDAQGQWPAKGACLFIFRCT